MQRIYNICDKITSKKSVFVLKNVCNETKHVVEHINMLNLAAIGCLWCGISVKDAW